MAHEITDASVDARTRRAGPADAAAVAEIYRRARHAAAGIPPLAHSDDEVRDWITETVVPAGDTWVTPAAGRPAAMLVLDADWIEQLYVDPAAQRRGHGGTLLRHAQARHPELSLWTFAANAAARAFYAVHGFTADGPPSCDNEEGAPALRYRWARDGPG